jgi:hypothetical protein
MKCGNARRQIAKPSSKASAFNIRVRDVKTGKIKFVDRRASESELEGYNEQSYQAQRKEHVVSEGCSCNAGFRRGIVLDPFMGSGTTAVVARKLDRDFIGFEVNPEYVRMAEARLEGSTRTKRAGPERTAS